MKLIIAEKPSLSAKIKAGLGPLASEYEFIPSFGHLMELAQPDEYLPDSVPLTPKGKKMWRLEDLPIIPTQWERKFKGDAGAAKQYKLIMSSLKKASLVIHAGDPDREGQLLIDELLIESGYTGPVKRLMVYAMDAPTIQKSFREMKDNSEYHNLFLSADARSKADWLVGMNLTREWTIVNRTVVSIGRVQTPTLYLIVKRDLEIESFVPKDYFLIKATVSADGGEVSVQYQPTDEEKEGEGFDEEGRLVKESIAKQIADGAKGEKAKVVKFDKKQKKENAPLPLDMSALQVECANKLGLTSAETLAAAQKLYEGEYTTYPRSECAYLPESIFDESPAILDHLPMDDSLRKQLDYKRKHKAWDSSKVGAHYAIIPTSKSGKGLSGILGNVYEIIWRRFAALFMPESITDTQSLEVEIDGKKWTANGSKVVQQGWRDMLGVKDTDNALPDITKGEEYPCVETELLAKKTTPPARFNDATIIEAMKSIHKYVDDPAMKALLKENSGLGTGATRDQVIETLIGRKYIERKSKKFISTEFGRALIAAMEGNDICYPTTTAIWEDQLGEVADGKRDVKQFMSDIEKWVKDNIGSAKPLPGSRASVQYPTAPCSIDGCEGTVRRLPSKKKKGVFFWACDTDHNEHGLIRDDNGKPGKAFSDRGEELPCPVDGCGGGVVRLESRKKPGLFFWMCSNKDKHAPLQDNDGKPGMPFEAPKSYGDGPKCTKCKVPTTKRMTKNDKPYYHCAKCRSSWWPDREDEDKLGTKWSKR